MTSVLTAALTRIIHAKRRMESCYTAIFPSVSADIQGRQMMFNLQNQSCPKCDSPEYNGNLSLEHLGIAKLRLIADTKCISCGFEREYTTSLE